MGGWNVESPPAGSLTQTAFVDCDPNDARLATIAGVLPAFPLARNNRLLLGFPIGVSSNAIWEKGMPPFYDIIKNLRVDIDWVAATAIAGSAKWDVSFEKIAPGGLNIDTDGFAAAKSITSATAGVNGVVTRSSITFTSAEADAIAGGDDFRLRVVRDNSVASINEDIQILRVKVSEL